MDIAVEIEGVTDRRIAGAIRTRVRVLGRTATRSGDRQVVVAPSETRGQWDLGLREPPFGWHLVSFMEPVDRLPEVVERRLRDLLERETGDGRVHYQS